MLWQLKLLCFIQNFGLVHTNGNQLHVSLMNSYHLSTVLCVEKRNFFSCEIVCVTTQ
jgi:hypothetical protein